MTSQPINLSEISELLEEDTDGLLLAQFLQKKSGPVRKCRFALLNYEPEPFSFTVNVRPIDTPIENTGNAAAENAICGDKNLPSVPVGNSSSSTMRLTPIRNSAINSDLRRSSLKRLHSLNIGGRRTLLKEFENTLATSDFSPQVFSTPVNAGPMRQSLIKEHAHVEPIIADVPPHPSGNAFTNTEYETPERNNIELMNSLRCHDTELRGMLQDMVEKSLKETVQEKEKNNATAAPTTSAVNVTYTTAQDIQRPPRTSGNRRTYTIQTGSLPGQVVLTPTQSPPFASDATQGIPTSASAAAADMQRTPTRASAAAAVTQRTPTRASSAAAVTQRTPTRVSSAADLQRTPTRDSAAAAVTQRTPTRASVAALQRTPTRGSTLQRTLTHSPRADMQRTPTHLLLSPRNPSKRSALHATNAPVLNKQAMIIRVKSEEDFLACPEKIGEYDHSFDITSRSRTVEQRGLCAGVPGTPISNGETQLQPEQMQEGNDELEIPETQDLHAETNMLVNSLRKSHSQLPLVIIPIHQTVNGSTPATLARSEAVNNIEKTATKTADSHDKSLPTKTADYHDKSSTSKDVNPTATSTSKVKDLPRSYISKAPTHTRSFSSKSRISKEVTLISSDDQQFSNIITDDEDERMPLNLAPPDEISTKRKRTRRDHKVSNAFTLMHMEQQHQNDAAATTQMTMNIKSGGPPPAHPLNLRSRNHQRSFATTTTTRATRKGVPLNKAPNTPINGEKFAGELKSHLASLNNRQILDLRKRNSLGKVYMRNTANEKGVIDKRLQLEEEIQLEILKRTLEGNNEGLDSESVGAEESRIAETGVNDLPSAPDGFNYLSARTTETPLPRDELEKALYDMQTEAEGLYSSSLVDERSSDRISFIPTSLNRTASLHRSRSKNRKPKKDKTSEMVQSYMEATQIIKRNKRKKRATSCKRSLYSKGYSDSESSLNTSAGKQLYSNKDDGISEIENIMPIPSPPREVVRSLRSHSFVACETVNVALESSEVLVPPPVQFLDQEATAPSERPPPVPFLDQEAPAPSKSRNLPHTPVASTTDANRTDTEIFKMPPIPAPRKKCGNSKSNASRVAAVPTDDEIFKKPLLPAPKKKRAKRSKVDAAIAASTVELESEEGKGLRRSKRAHVPTDYSFLDMMFQKVEESTEKRKAYRKRVTQQTLRENDLYPIASSTANLTASCSAKNSSTKTKRMQKANQYKLVKEQQKAKPPYSFLGDTDASSSSSISCEAPTPLYRNRLSTIFEPEAAEHVPESVNRTESITSQPPPPPPSQSFSPPPASPSYSPTPPLQISPPLLQPLLPEPSPPRSTIIDDELPTTSKNIRAKLAQKSLASINDDEDEVLRSLRNTTKKDKKATAIIPDDDVLSTNSRNKKTEKEKSEVVADKTKSMKTTKAKKRNGLECSRIIVPAAPVNELNNIFDQLKNASTISNKNDAVAATPFVPTATTPTIATSQSGSSSTQSGKRSLCVRLKRCKMGNTAESSSSSTSSNIATTEKNQQQQKEKTANSTETNIELLTWLKGISDMHNAPSPQHVKIFEDMRVSAGGNLIFSNLEGVEYAFYDTDTKASLGYLRFKPHQMKSEKRAKKYHLHFIVLEGTFEIKTNRDKGSFGIGDLIAINIGSRYTIQNIGDDIGLLMVIKK